MLIKIVEKTKQYFHCGCGDGVRIVPSRFSPTTRQQHPK
jgi:hypothetical protein